MRDITKMTEQTAAKVEVARLAVEVASRKVSQHDADTDAKRVRFERLDSDNRAFRTAIALHETPKVVQPSVEELENLRTDLELSANVALVLNGRRTAANLALVAAKRAHRDGYRNHLVATVMAPANAELQAAFDHLRDAAAKQMAAHYVVHRKLNDDAPVANDPLDLYGPTAEFLYQIRLRPWADYPYSIRPGWLPVHGTFWPDELPGVHDRIKELLVGVEGALS